MAFVPAGLSDVELNLYKDHSRLITGTGAAILAGHGYLEDDDRSHMDGIVRLYSKFRGEGVSPVKSNDAMRAGIEAEPIAFGHLEAALKSPKGVLEGYTDLRTYPALSGLRLDSTDGESYGLGANLDAPLVDVSGEAVDPMTGKTIPMEAYAAKWARIEFDRQNILKSNELREAMGEPKLPVPNNPLKEPRYAGVADLKATMQYDVRLEVENAGPYPGWCVQVHHYNMALKELNAQNGYDNEQYPNVLMIGHFYSGDMKTRIHPIPFDPALEDKLKERYAIFMDCVGRGISPDSPSMRAHFSPIPIKRFTAPSKLASPEIEERLEKGFRQLDYCNDMLEEWEGQKKQTLSKIQEFYEGEIEKPNQALYAKGRELQLYTATRSSKSLNREALDGVVGAASDTRSKVEEAIQALSNGGDPEAVLEILQKIKLNQLPEKNVKTTDSYEVTIEKESPPKFNVKETKKAQKVYELLIKSSSRQSESISIQTPNEPVSKSASPKGSSTTQEPQPDEVVSHEEPNVPPALSAGAPKPIRPIQEPPVSADAKPDAGPADTKDDIKVKPPEKRTPNPFAM